MKSSKEQESPRMEKNKTHYLEKDELGRKMIGSKESTGREEEEEPSELKILD